MAREPFWNSMFKIKRGNNGKLFKSSSWGSFHQPQASKQPCVTATGG